MHGWSGHNVNIQKDCSAQPKTSFTDQVYDWVCDHGIPKDSVTQSTTSGWVQLVLLATATSGGTGAVKLEAWKQFSRNAQQTDSTGRFRSKDRDTAVFIRDTLFNTETLHERFQKINIGPP